MVRQMRIDEVDIVAEVFCKSVYTIRQGYVLVHWRLLFSYQLKPILELLLHEIEVTMGHSLGIALTRLLTVVVCSINALLAAGSSLAFQISLGDLAAAYAIS